MLHLFLRGQYSPIKEKRNLTSLYVYNELQVNQNYGMIKLAGNFYSPVHVVDGVTPVIFIVPTETGKTHTHIAPGDLSIKTYR